MPPNRLIVRTFANRGFRLWVLTRLLVSAVVAFGRENPLALSPTAIAAIVAFSAAAAFFDARRRHELALLGNLGISYGTYSAMVATPAVAGEILLWVVAAALR